MQRFALIALLVLVANLSAFAKSSFQLKVDYARELIDSFYYVDALDYLYHLQQGIDFNTLNSIEKEVYHVTLATTLHHLGDNQEACNQLHNAIFHAKKVRTESDFGVALKYGQIGSYFLQSDNQDSCFKNFRLGIKHISRVKKPLYHASALNNLGLAFAHFSQTDSALYSYKKGLQILDTNNNRQTRFKSLIISNIAKVYYEQGNISKSILQLKKAIRNIENNNCIYKEHKPLFYKSLLFQKLELADTKNIKKILDSVLVSIPRLRNSNKRFENFLSTLLQVKDLNLITEDKFNYLYTAYSDSLITSLNGIINQNKNGAVSYKQQALNQFKKINELKTKSRELELKNTKRKNKLTLLIGASLLSISLLFLVMILQRFKKRKLLFAKQSEVSKLEIENQKLKEQQLQSELKQKSEDITNLAIYNKKKQEWNASIIKRLSSIKKGEANDIKKALKQLEVELNQQNIIEEKAITLQENIDIVNSSFKERLFQMHKNLTVGEIELCSYLKIGMSGKEIAQIRGVSPESITKAKQRLKKKINLSNNSLEAFIESI
ncbi:MAG: hypothetical protein ACPGLV_12315 [Bacteroidia bacterium]